MHIYNVKQKRINYNESRSKKKNANKELPIYKRCYWDADTRTPSILSSGKESRSINPREKADLIDRFAKEELW